MNTNTPITRRNDHHKPSSSAVFRKENNHHLPPPTNHTSKYVSVKNHNTNPNNKSIIVGEMPRSSTASWTSASSSVAPSTTSSVSSLNSRSRPPQQQSLGFQNEVANVNHMLSNTQLLHCIAEEEQSISQQQRRHKAKAGGSTRRDMPPTTTPTSSSLRRIRRPDSSDLQSTTSSSKNTTTTNRTKPEPEWSKIWKQLNEDPHHRAAPSTTTTTTTTTTVLPEPQIRRHVQISYPDWTATSVASGGSIANPTAGSQRTLHDCEDTSVSEITHATLTPSDPYRHHHQHDPGTNCMVGFTSCLPFQSNNAKLVSKWQQQLERDREQQQQKDLMQFYYNSGAADRGVNNPHHNPNHRMGTIAESLEPGSGHGGGSEESSPPPPPQSQSPPPNKENPQSKVSVPTIRRASSSPGAVTPMMEQQFDQEVKRRFHNNNNKNSEMKVALQQHLQQQQCEDGVDVFRPFPELGRRHSHHGGGLGGGKPADAHPEDRNDNDNSNDNDVDNGGIPSKHWFLQAEQCSVKKAAQRYVHYWEMRLTLWGPETAFFPLTQVNTILATRKSNNSCHHDWDQTVFQRGYVRAVPGFPQVLYIQPHTIASDISTLLRKQMTTIQNTSTTTTTNGGGPEDKDKKGQDNEEEDEIISYQAAVLRSAWYVMEKWWRHNNNHVAMQVGVILILDLTQPEGDAATTTTTTMNRNDGDDNEEGGLGSGISAVPNYWMTKGMTPFSFLGSLLFRGKNATTTATPTTNPTLQFHQAILSALVDCIKYSFPLRFQRICCILPDPSSSHTNNHSLFDSSSLQQWIHSFLDPSEFCQDSQLHFIHKTTAATRTNNEKLATLTNGVQFQDLDGRRHYYSVTSHRRDDDDDTNKNHSNNDPNCFHKEWLAVMKHEEEETEEWEGQRTRKSRMMDDSSSLLLEALDLTVSFQQRPDLQHHHPNQINRWSLLKCTMKPMTVAVSGGNTLSSTSSSSNNKEQLISPQLWAFGKRQKKRSLRHSLKQHGVVP